MSRLQQCGAVMLVITVFYSASLPAQQAGEHVSVSGQVEDDIYLAGGQVDVYATVDGDVVVAGGQLNLEGDVRQDVIAAGGDVELRGRVGDDARLAGGNVRVLAKTGDDLVAAGGRLHVAPNAEIGGSAWLSGGEVRMEGRVGEHLHAGGGRVAIAGTVAGNAEVWAEHVEIAGSTIINGHLQYRSPHPAVIAEGARIDGEITHIPVEAPAAPVAAALVFAGLMFLLSLVLTGAVLYLAFPGVAERCSEMIRSGPWAGFGYGLAVIAGAPVVMVLLFSTGLGAWLALLLLALYFLLLPTGYLVGAFLVADAGLRKMNRTPAGRKVRVLAVSVSIAGLFIVNLVPVLGSLLNWLVLLAGTGALVRVSAASYRASA